MTRFAWLQSRTQTLIVAGLLAALALAAAITGVQLSHLYDSLVAHCQSDCGLATTQFLSHDRFLQHALDLLAQVIPALLGLFWGAPLIARELETGTFRLAWTQSVSRRRWLVTKLAFGAGATALVAGLFTLTVTWWYRSFDPLDTNQFAVFDRRDIVPIGYAVFAFAVGALIGAVVRRSLPAMATTLAVYVFARVATTMWVRPHLLPPLHRTVSLLDADRFGFVSRAGSGGPSLSAYGSAPGNAWTVSSHVMTRSGQPATKSQLSAFVQKYCPGIAAPPGGAPTGHGITKAPDPSAFSACQAQASHMFHLLVAYQPANRYWTFQWFETGIFAVLALLAAVACYWWVGRRTA